jgi:ribosome-binding ATPase YchF (GTP1/OBG family)
VRGLALSDNEKALVKSLFLLTSKPTLYIANVDEDGLEGNATSTRCARSPRRRTPRWW